MNVKRILALLMAISLLLFVGCDVNNLTKENESTEAPVTTGAEDQATEEKAPEAAADDEVSLADWEGEWNSLAAYVNDAELEDAFSKAAEEHGESVDEVKEEIVEDYGVSFNAMKIAGDQITFLDGKAGEGKEIETVTYKFVKSHEMEHAGHKFFWHIFEAQGDATYKILFMMPVHGEETLVHFHLRCGNDIDELMAKDDWYPTFVKPEATPEQLGEVFSHHHDHEHEHEHEHGDEHEHEDGDEHEHEDGDHDHDDHEMAIPAPQVLDDVTLEDWAGEWNATAAYLDDEALQPVIEKAAKEKKESVEEYKEDYREAYRLNFETMVFEGETVKFYDHRLDHEGKEIAKVTYKYVESYEMQHGEHKFFWHIFEAEKGAEHKYLMLMPVHGEEVLTHFHMRVGDDIKEMLEEDEWWPTLVKASTTAEQLEIVYSHRH